MKVSYILAFVAARSAVAFPWVARAPGVDSSKLDYRSVEHNVEKRATCPYNANHKGAAAYNSKYPYTGAKNGAPGTQVGGVPVPAPGDSAHAFVAPGKNDIRGPCPGLNTAANHNFLAHDGITTFSELVDAQQNLYNVGYDLAVVLATLGVSLDGDIFTGKLSIGCDATSRTSLTGTGLLGQELGLDGHNKFESDTSLTRNDYFLANGDDYSYNASLFKHMTQTTGGNYDLTGLAQYRLERYQESLATNPNFYFGPKSLLLYGAATFLYELFPGSSNQPDVATISSFFGAGPAPDYKFTGQEKIPAYWKNRVTPYTLLDVTEQILAMYALHPVLFGGNAGVGNFDALGSFEDIKNGQLPIDVNATVCLIYQLATENVPSSLSTVLELPLQVVQFVTGQLNPIFKNYGCPLKLT